MNAHPADAPEPVLLSVADISGYTRYMTANARTLAHSQTIITELIQAVVREIELPLEIAKLEGDAIFLFCRKQNPALAWPEARRLIGERLLTFFHRFNEKLAELTRSTTCTCHPCTHIEKLRLKIVVHSGEALFHRVLNFTELAGVDVIIVHRLLKNSIKAGQYLLLTEPARRDLEFPETVSLAQSTETYDDIGRINTLVHLPAGETAAGTPPENSFGKKFGQSWKLLMKLWFAPLAVWRGGFHNLESGVGAAKKISWAVLTVLLTPICVPVGTILVLLRALKSPRKFQQASHRHEHDADGS